MDLFAGDGFEQLGPFLGHAEAVRWCFPRDTVYRGDTYPNSTLASLRPDASSCEAPPPVRRPGQAHAEGALSAGKKAASLEPSSSARSAGGRAQACSHPPCVRVFATYWPQFHATPLNDWWLGRGYTDWDLLCQSPRANRQGHTLMRPLPTHLGGLGWYNLSDRSTRRRQAMLAREFGVYGFAMYHCEPKPRSNATYHCAPKQRSPMAVACAWHTRRVVARTRAHAPVRACMRVALAIPQPSQHTPLSLPLARRLVQPSCRVGPWGVVARGRGERRGYG